MNFNQAQIYTNQLNENGNFKDDWFYYPACYDGENSKFYGEWFVLRRPKNTKIVVAVFADGKVNDGVYERIN